MKNKIIALPVLALSLALIFAFVGTPVKDETSSATLVAADKGIRFVEPNWSKAVAEAKKQKKLIFIDAYTTWCGPCRMLKQNTFTDQAVGEFFNKNFINIALDMERGDGLAIAERYQVRAYPTLLIVDADQKSTYVTEGYMPPAQLLEFGKSAFNQKRN